MQALSHIVARLRAAGCVWAEDEARLLAEAASGPAELDGLVARRVAGAPLEHVVGWAAFCGLRVEVDPGVFVPRRRSEFLVEQACAAWGRAVRATCPLVVDLCCGSGALGLAVAVRLGQARLHAADVEPVAVRCARRNLARVGGVVHEGDLFGALPGELRGSIDLLVANVPYVPTAAVGLMPAEARLHEPRTALDGGPDGLDLARRVAIGAPVWLAPGGIVLIETGAQQAEALAAAFTTATIAFSAELDATVVIGR